MLFQKIEQEYGTFYGRIREVFEPHPGWIRGLWWANALLVILMYIAYPVLLCLVFRQSGSVTAPLFLRVLGVPAISFALVTVVRSSINRPRPYETHGFKPLIPRNKQGESLPSRHVFSSAIIAMTYLYLYPLWGVAFLVVSALSAVTRVLGGVHYPSDVFAGFVIGVGAGLLYWL